MIIRKIRHNLDTIYQLLVGLGIEEDVAETILSRCETDIEKILGGTKNARR